MPSMLIEHRAQSAIELCEKQKQPKDFFKSFSPSARIAKQHKLKIDNIAIIGAKISKISFKMYILNFIKIKNPKIKSLKNMQAIAGFEFLIMFRIGK